MLMSTDLGKQQRRGIALVAAYVFILFAFPRAGLRLGPAPVYFLDMLAGMIVLYGLSVPAPKLRRKIPFLAGTVVLLVLIFMSELRGIAFGASVSDAVYLVVRIMLGAMVMFFLPKFVREERDLIPLFKAATAAILITSILMITTSLPATRGFVSETVFSLGFLEPATDGVTRTFMAEAGIEVGQRGRSLVGVSILSATFINIAFPFIAILMLYRKRLSGFWRRVTIMAVLLAPAAVLLSYSRGPILGFILLFVGALVINWKRFSKSFIVPAIALIVGVAAVGGSSQVFMFDRLQVRTEAMLNAPLDDQREFERVLAYSEPFTHLAANPRFAALGEGNAIRRSEVAAAIDEKSNHALFAAAYYAYGLIAAVLFHLIILQAFFVIYRAQSKPDRTAFGEVSSQAVLLSAVAFLPWIAFGHAVASEPRGTAVFFLMLGLVAAVNNMAAPTKSRHDESLPAGPATPHHPQLATSLPNAPRSGS